MSISTTLPTGPSKVEIFDFLKELIMSGIFEGCRIRIADGISERAYGYDFVEHLRTYKGLFNVEEFKKHIANRTQQIEDDSKKMIEERRNEYEEYLESILDMVDASLSSSQYSEDEYKRKREKKKYVASGRKNADFGRKTEGSHRRHMKQYRLKI